MRERLTVEGAAQVLDALGCAKDLVYRRGRATTVEDLAWTPLGNTSRNAYRFRIEFYGGRRNPVLRRGTLVDMIMDRLGKRNGSRRVRRRKR